MNKNRPLARQQPVTPLPAVRDGSPVAIMMNAVAQGMPLEKIEKMMDLQERYERNEARKAFVQAMTYFKAEPLEIFKKKQVAFMDVRYKHAELSSVTDVIIPALARHGFSHRWDITQKDNLITVSCTVTHNLGHSETVSMQGAPDTSGKKNAIQSLASAVTYLKRYTLLAITGLSTKEEVDDDGRGGEDEEVDPATLDAAYAAARAVARKGLGAFREYFSALSEDERKLIEPIADEIKATAKEHTLPKDQGVALTARINAAPTLEELGVRLQEAVEAAEPLGDTFACRVFREAASERSKALQAQV